jgi:hypothetical protein
MKRLSSCSSACTGTDARSISCSGENGVGVRIFASQPWRMASTSDDHRARSPLRTRSASSAQAAASRQAVYVTTV